MASSSSFSEDLTCSVCLIIFTDPVTLFCGHSFCRECITLSLKSLNQCPQCRATVPTDMMDFTTNHILKSLAEKAKKEKKSGKDTEAAVGFCPEHDEKLKLFCVTDQQLTCIICRDCERHEGHKFKPVKEAAASIRKEVETLVEKETSDICAIEHLVESQNEEIRKSEEKSQQLRIQISSQFQEMHQFLKRREDEILNELKDKEKDELEKMRRSLNVVEKALTEGREVGEQMKSVLEVTDPESFLKSWSESKMTPKPKSNPKASDLRVVTSSLSLGHYESHLQLFVWKEMRQMIQPQAERLLFKTQDPPDWSKRSRLSCSCKVSTGPVGFSNLFSSCNCSSNYNTLLSECQKYYTLQTTNIVNVNQIAPGPHYWEIDVEDKKCWTVQIKNHSLMFKNNKYTTTHKKTVKEVKFANKPKKIGFYLNGNSEELHFFDADTMQHVEV
ncbi:nuclear factor 7, brain-like [Poecilia latipinna]|uniref:nuclear factor 7, brain-like n=1 Tax=Poecilia mexicana TaxID=48701 RepID=UPI00072DB9F4|nr:PREDICTED: nuclear factor 7, brain-like [Poecilia mexicana]XP_014895454.1 PREDICTED: nuclear factor 7, brain-like [Poecilia latipinna]